MIFTEAKPGKAHLILAKWETEGKVKAVITQNIEEYEKEYLTESLCCTLETNTTL